MVIITLRCCWFRVLGAECAIYRKDITCAWSKGLSVVFIYQNATHACVWTAFTLTENDLGQLDATTDKAKQDVILSPHMAVQQCKRKRPRVEYHDRHRNRVVLVKYSSLKENKEKVPVCQASFLSIFSEYNHLLTLSLVDLWEEA